MKIRPDSSRNLVKTDWLGLGRAWKQGELASHPVFIVASGLLFAIFLAVLLCRGAGRWSSYELTDFSQPDSRWFSVHNESSRVRQVFRFSVKVVGNIDGEIDLYVHQEKLARLSGKTNSRFHVDIDVANTVISLKPASPSTGHLIVHHRFHYR